MKKILPIILAGVAFLAVWLFLSPEPKGMAVVAATNVSVGHILESSDIEVRSIPEDMIPEDAIRNINDIIGKTLIIDRAAGDIIRASQVGEEVINLAPDERAIAITVDNATGFGGLLTPGDYIGLNAIISLPGNGEEGTYSKVAVEGLRILYLSPEFRALDPDALDPETDQTSGAVYITEREQQGIAILAVPIDAETIVYDFSKVDSTVSTKSTSVYVIELLTALESSANAELYLYLMPRNAERMITSGLWLEDVVVLAHNPTPTINPMLYLEETPIP